MPAFFLKTARVVGVPTQSSGSWLHSFCPTDEKKESHGQLLAALTVTTLSKRIDVATAGREITARIHEEYFGQLEETPLKRLEKAVAKVAQEGGDELGIEIIAVVLAGSAMLAVSANGGALILSRKGKAALILEGKPGQTETVSGYGEDGDIFLVTTTSFFKMIPAGVLRAALGSGQVAEIGETLAPIIHGQLDSEKAGALVAAVTWELPVEAPVLALKKEPEGAKFKIALYSLFANCKRKLFLVRNSLRRRLAGRPFAIWQKLEPESRQQKTVTTVAFLLLLILGLSVFFGARQKGNLQQAQKVKELLLLLGPKLEEAESLLTLNLAESRQLYLDLEKMSQEVGEAGQSSPAYRQFKERLAAFGEKVIREYAVEGTVFYDLELIRAGARGEQMIKKADQLIVLDKSQAAVYQIGIKDRKQLTLAAGEKVAQASFWGVTQKPFVVADEGIFRLEGSQAKLVLALAEEEKELTSATVFANNLYLLTKAGEIFKYQDSEELGFRGKRKWLTSRYPSLKEAMTMAIDGSIWVLEKEGKIEKFTQGAKERLALSGLADPLTGASRLYLDKESQNFYVLDREKQRVVVFLKSGQYQAEYQWPKIKEVTDLVAEEEEKKIFLLIESKIYSIDLK